MNENQTRMAAANLLLERGVRFRIDAPFYKRWLGLDRITMRPLYPGTICEISRIILENELESATPEKALDKMDAVCRIVATAILNDERKIMRKADGLAKQLRTKIPAHTLNQIFLHISEVNSVLDFTIITNYFSGLMNQIMTTKSMGRQEKGR